MTDFAAARRSMVDGQVRTSDVTDLRLIAAFQETARERFLPPAAAGLAYLDLDVPLGEGRGSRRLLKPMVLAKLIQALDIDTEDRVLDVGCASGYSSAILSQFAGQVVALEEDPPLARMAADNLRARANVTIASGALAVGWPAAAPYDAILINGAVEIPPQALINQLKDGGRLACVFGSGPAGRATLYCRSDDETAGRAIFDAAAPLLPGFVRPPAFAF